MHSFSDVPCTSLLAYPSKRNFPQPQFDLQREKILAIKRDQLLPNKSPPTRAIPYVALAIRRHMETHDVLQGCFAGAIIAVPVPRSKLQRPHSLWPALRICEELKAVGLVCHVATLLRRTRAVLPSHQSSSAETRSCPEDHYETIAIDSALPQVDDPHRLLLVDDIVTRGSTFLACHALLQEALPFHEISAFAVARTVSSNPKPILQPVSGVCSCPAGVPFCTP